MIALYRFHGLLQAPEEVMGDHADGLVRRLPGAIIIGVPKGGTSALINFLNLHPQIEVSPKEEPHFFDYDINYRKGFSYYRRLMPLSRPDQITIEKTPMYFYVDAVPRRIYAMNRTIKLILIVRDPVERAISNYEQVKAEVRGQGKKFTKTFEDVAFHKALDNDAYSRSIMHSLYDIYLERWLKLFPVSQFHFVDGEQFAKSPFESLKRIEGFLGLSPFFREDQFNFSANKGFYCITKAVGNGTIDQCMGSNKGRDHSPVSKRSIAKLRRYFRPHNERFYSMVGIDFDWPTA